MYTGNLDISGIIHDCKCIAEIETIEMTKAEPFLTLPQEVLNKSKYLYTAFRYHYYPYRFSPVCCDHRCIPSGNPASTYHRFQPFQN